jgi:glycerone phosphate O-acyltransferase/fatty acyl-CoA reductase
VPVDMVADHILVAAAFRAGIPELEVYNLCSSARNPMTWRVAKESVKEYWNKYPTP